MTEKEEKGHFGIDLGRQGGVLALYIVAFLGYYGIIANTVMFDEYGRWISFYDMDKAVLFSTFETYISILLDPAIFFLILILIMVLIIIFSLIKWDSFPILSILIPGLIIFISDFYWTIIYLPLSIITGSLIFIFNIQSLALLLLFFVCFGLTYKEDIPAYGIKASIWLVPLLIAEAFILYTIMFGFSIEPFILQFGSGEGYVNILILILTTLAGSLSGMKLKKLKKDFKIRVDL